ncbi:MAG: MFS transporter [Sphingomonadales bacterium]|nr:MFS transporter [Sphingomonadales bacterium]MDE2171062.1 MFS transporter [Sphingomonadales bacterium]
MTDMKATRARVGLIFLLFGISAIAFLDRTNISVAGLEMQQAYGIDKQELGFVFSAFLVGYAAFQVPAGWLAVRFGPRVVLACALVWWGIFTAATALVPPGAAHALWWLVGVRFALGLGESVVYPSGNQFLSRWVPATERGKANGLIFAGVGAGSGITPPLITGIIAWGGWQAAFYVCAGAGLLAGGVWYALARDTPQEHHGVNAAELAHITAGTAAVSPEAPVHSGAIPWGVILSSRNVWGLFLSYFAFGYVAWIFFSWFYIYLAEARHLDLKSTAMFSMLPFLCMTVGCLAGGVINDRLSASKGLYAGRSGLAILSFILTGIFLVAGVTASSVGLAVVVLAGGAGAVYLSQSSFWAATTDIAGRHTGVVSGLMNMGCQLGGVVTSSLTPWIAERYGWTSAFVAGAVVVVVGALAWAVVNPNRRLFEED